MGRITWKMSRQCGRREDELLAFPGAAALVKMCHMLEGTGFRGLLWCSLMWPSTTGIVHDSGRVGSALPFLCAHGLCGPSLYTRVSGESGGVLFYVALFEVKFSKNWQQQTLSSLFC